MKRRNMFRNDNLKKCALAIMYSLLVTISVLCIVQGCSSENINIIFVSENGSTIYLVPKSTKVLSISYTHFQTITGLENLPRLDTLKVYFTDEMSDYSFIKGLSIRRIVITNAYLESLRFIAETPSLELVYLESSQIDSIEPIDLGRHPHIRLLDLEKCHLTVFPLYGSIPKTLEYLWLFRNDIETLDREMVAQLSNIKSVSLLQNPIVNKLNDLGLSPLFGEDRPADNELPADLRRFFIDWWAADYSITGKDRP